MGKLGDKVKAKRRYDSASVSHACSRVCPPLKTKRLALSLVAIPRLGKVREYVPCFDVLQKGIYTSIALVFFQEPIALVGIARSRIAFPNCVPCDYDEMREFDFAIPRKHGEYCPYISEPFWALYAGCLWDRHMNDASGLTHIQQ